MKKRWQEKDKETTAGSAGYEKDERIMVVEQEIDGKKRNVFHISFVAFSFMFFYLIFVLVINGFLFPFYNSIS